MAPGSRLAALQTAAVWLREAAVRAARFTIPGHTPCKTLLPRVGVLPFSGC